VKTNPIEKSFSLYEISEKYLNLLDNLEIDEETGDLLNADELEIALSEFDEKSENYALYIKNLKANAEAIKAEQQKLSDRKKSIDQKIEILSDRLGYAMFAFNKTKFETPKVALSFRKSESVNIIDEDVIPALFMLEKTTFEPDKNEIKRALKSGQVISGAEILVKQNLQIK
jgi:hypothetical protein